MKRKYVEAEISVVLLQDVIATSDQWETERVR